MASKIEKRIHQLVEKLRQASETADIEWREGPNKTYVLNVGAFAIGIAKDADPQLTIFDDQGEEIEALERHELAAFTASDGRNYSELSDRIWRLARRSSGTAQAAFDKIIAMLDEKAGGETDAPAEAPAVDEVEPAPAAPQAPQSGMEQAAEEAAQAADEEPAIERPASNGNGQGAVNANDDDDDDDTPARRPFWS